MRSVPEWSARHDDEAIPVRVKLRVAKRFNDCCADCGQPLIGAEFDHIEPLWAGGEHRETNLQPLCGKHHKLKTAKEALERAKANRIKAKHIGVHKPKGRPLAGTKASGWKRKMDGTVERRT